MQMERRPEEDSLFKENYEQMVSTLDLPMERTTPHRTAARNTRLNVGYTQSIYPPLTVIPRGVGTQQNVHQTQVFPDL